MKVVVNKKDKIVPVNCTLEMLMTILNIKTSDPVAIAIGEEVIESKDYPSIILKEGDKITIIKATCGG